MVSLIHRNRNRPAPPSHARVLLLVRHLVSLIVALVAVLLAGCRPRLDSLRAAPRLTFEELQRGKVAVLPLSAKIKEVTLRDLERLDVIYMYAFDQHAHGQPRVPSTVVAAALESNYTNWDTVVRFADTHQADYEVLQWLSTAVGARYLIFSWIEYAEIYDTSQARLGAVQRHFQADSRAGLMQEQGSGRGAKRRLIERVQALTPQSIVAWHAT